MKETVLEKLKVLAESAKYDVSCASSGVTRKHRAGGVGSAAGWGICHSFTADGRCVSLLKIMLTNVCIYDCAYCINRRSNDIPRAAFTPGELAELTIEFYRRNYIEGLFLSSGVVRDPDYTMERMVRVARDLRTVHRFDMPIDAADVEPFPNAQAKHDELFKVLRGRYGLIARPRHTPVVDGHPPHTRMRDVPTAHRCGGYGSRNVSSGVAVRGVTVCGAAHNHVVMAVRSRAQAGPVDVAPVAEVMP